MDFVSQIIKKRKKLKSAQHPSNTYSDSIALGTSSGDVLVYDVAAGEVNQRLVRMLGPHKS